jgi:hypothetical protein
MDVEIFVFSYRFQERSVLEKFYGKLKRKFLLPDRFEYGRYCGDTKNVEEHDESICDDCVVGGKILMKMFLMAKYFETKMLKKVLENTFGRKRIILEHMIVLNDRRDFLLMIRRYSVLYNIIPIRYRGGRSQWRITLMGNDGDTYDGVIEDGKLVLKNCCPDNEYLNWNGDGKKYWMPEINY